MATPKNITIYNTITRMSTILLANIRFLLLRVDIQSVVPPLPHVQHAQREEVFGRVPGACHHVLRVPLNYVSIGHDVGDLAKLEAGVDAHNVHDVAREDGVQVGLHAPSGGVDELEEKVEERRKAQQLYATDLRVRQLV